MNFQIHFLALVTGILFFSSAYVATAQTSVEGQKDYTIPEVTDYEFILMSKPGSDGETGQRTGDAMLGVHVRKAGETLRRHLKIDGKFGLVIEHVTSGSAAENARLESHDILYKIDGQVLVNVEQLHSLIEAKKPGDEVEVEFFRSGNSERQTIALTERTVPAVDSTLSALQDYHQQLWQSGTENGQGTSVIPHNLAAQFLNCRSCHTATEPATLPTTIRFLKALSAADALDNPKGESDSSGKNQ